MVPQLYTERLCLRGFEPRDFEPYATRGRGYAREGAAAALAYARDTLGRADVISIIRPANAASIRVACALGARRDATVEFFGSPSDIYRYPPRAASPLSPVSR